jgi:hypothetical protein
MGNKNSTASINFIKKLENNLTPAILSSAIYKDFTEKANLIIPNNPYYSNNKPVTPPVTPPVTQSNPVKPVSDVSAPITVSKPPPEKLPDIEQYPLNNTNILFIFPAIVIGFTLVYYAYTKYVHKID